jgi:DNA glycosylase AlkZ-like
VVRRSGAVQSQDHQPALWSLARRCCGPAGGPPTEEELSAAFDAAAFVRLHVLRPTWHFVAPERLRDLVALSGPRVAASLAGRRRDLALSAQLLEEATCVLVSAITERGPLTRPGAGEALEAAGIGIDGQRLPHLLMHAELAGVLASGPTRGRQHVRTFVRSHAPATERDLAWWSGLSLTDVRAGLEAARPELDVFEAGGRRYWHAGEPRDVVVDGGKTAVHLVQSYDEYLVAHTESRGIADPHGFARHMPRGALLGPAVLLDGVVVGLWRRALGPRRVDVVVTRFTSLPRPALAALEVEAERYAAFVERPLRLVVEDALEEGFTPTTAATSGPPTTSAG